MRSKRMQSSDSLSSLVKPFVSVTASVPAKHPQLSIIQASVSLSLSSEVTSLREELAKVAVVSIIDGFVNIKSVIEVLPIINTPLPGPIT